MRNQRNAWGTVALLVLVLLLALAGCLKGRDQDVEHVDHDVGGLRRLAKARGMRVGASLEPALLQNNQAYRELVAREFNLVTPGNAMKWDTIHPEQQRYAFNGADAMVEFARENGMEVRGHTLVWHRQIPPWLGDVRREEVADVLRDHIKTVVGRYRGKVRYWDVVNEALGNQGELRENFWLRTIGPDYVKLAFQWAHEADPDALLFYNEYGAEGLGSKSDGVYAFVASLKARNVPIHGVGLQSHYEVRAAPSPRALGANMERLAQLGLQVHITELDVRMAEPASPEDLEQQALIYRRVLDSCLGRPACTAFVVWEVYDGASWVPTEFPGFGSAHLFDEQMQPKPAYQAMASALAGS